MSGPEIAVVFTGAETTAAALETAGRLAQDQSRAIRLMVVRTVPFPLPLSQPTIPVEFTARQVLRLAFSVPARTRIEVYLCRDRQEVLRTQLRAGSRVVIGGKLRWWPTSEQRLANWLQAAGHQVIFVAPYPEETVQSSYSRLLQFRVPNSTR